MGHTPGRVYRSYPGLWGIDSELLSPVAGVDCIPLKARVDDSLLVK